MFSQFLVIDLSISSCNSEGSLQAVDYMNVFNTINARLIDLVNLFCYDLCFLPHFSLMDWPLPMPVIALAGRLHCQWVRVF